MSIIINGFHKPEYFPVIDYIVSLYPSSKVHIIYENIRIAHQGSHEVVFYPCAKLSHEFAYEIDSNHLTPLDSDIIEQMADCEAVCLKMMDRDEAYSEWTYDRRKKAYLSHLRYWNHVIRSEQVELFISSNLPHVIYDFIIYNLCKLSDIETVLFFQFQPGFSILMKDWQDPTPGMKEQLLKFTNVPLGIDYLPERIKDEWIRQRSGKDITPFYIQSFQEKQSKFKETAQREEIIYFRHQIFSLVRAPLKKIRKLLDLDFLINWGVTKIRQYKLIRKELSLAKTYEKLCSEPSLQETFVYLPLHTQPELSTSPMGGVFVDQLLIAQLVAYCLPENVKIYIKEHPTQYMSRREDSFYRSLLDIPSIRLVSRKYESSKLIQNCKFIGTCTGTAGWEALFKGKPVLLFGYPFFKDAPGTFEIHSLSDCKSAVDKIFSNTEVFDEGKFLTYLVCLDQHVVYADIDPDYSTQGKLSADENAAILIKSLVGVLQN